MKLCFDATRFGAGLEGAIDIASQKGIPCVEYSFEPFPSGGKTGRDLKTKERKYLESVAALSQEKGVEIACLNLLYSHSPGDKNSKKKFLGMMEKLSKVAAVGAGGSGSARASHRRSRSARTIAASRRCIPTPSPQLAAARSR